MSAKSTDEGAKSKTEKAKATWGANALAMSLLLHDWGLVYYLQGSHLSTAS